MRETGDTVWSTNLSPLSMTVGGAQELVYGSIEYRTPDYKERSSSVNFCSLSITRLDLSSALTNV